jgi:hypothetical protein
MTVLLVQIGWTGLGNDTTRYKYPPTHMNSAQAAWWYWVPVCFPGSSSAVLCVFIIRTSTHHSHLGQLAIFHIAFDYICVCYIPRVIEQRLIYRATLIMEGEISSESTG